jgi:hypothetical protein
MWVHRSDKAEAQDGMGEQGGGGARQQPPERVGVVAGQAELLGDLAEAGLHPVAQGSDRAARGVWRGRGTERPGGVA